MAVSRWFWLGPPVLVILAVALWPEKKPEVFATSPAAVDEPLASTQLQPGEPIPKYRLFSGSGEAAEPMEGDAPPSSAVSQAPATIAAAPAGSSTIPDGIYDCKIWSGSSYIDLGKVRSVNNSLDSQLLAKVGATFTGAQATADGITVLYTTSRGYRESMDCARL